MIVSGVDPGRWFSDIFSSVRSGRDPIPIFGFWLKFQPCQINDDFSHRWDWITYPRKLSLTFLTYPMNRGHVENGIVDGCSRFQVGHRLRGRFILLQKVLSEIGEWLWARLLTKKIGDVWLAHIEEIVSWTGPGETHRASRWSLAARWGLA